MGATSEACYLEGTLFLTFAPSLILKNPSLTLKPWLESNLWQPPMKWVLQLVQKTRGRSAKVAVFIACV